MGKTLTLAFVGAFTASIAAAATLEEYDGNTDGMITFDEVIAVSPDVSEDVFRLIDANEDGMIDADEFAMAQETGLLPAS